MYNSIAQEELQTILITRSFTLNKSLGKRDCVFRIVKFDNANIWYNEILKENCVTLEGKIYIDKVRVHSKQRVPRSYANTEDLQTIV